METCNKNDLLAGGNLLPACLREAEFVVTVTHNGQTETRSVCGSCVALFRRDTDSSITVAITELPSTVRQLTVRRCESPSTRNATSATHYTTCNAVLDGDACPEAGDHVEL